MIPKSGLTHEDRTQFLDTLAILLGCSYAVRNGLPDGRRPDVLRIDNSKGFLFVGDAKHTESPGCRRTQGRLYNYLRWLAAHVASGRDGLFAVCFGKRAETRCWIKTLCMLWRKAAVGGCEPRVEEFGHGLIVVWIRATSSQ